ncbi:MAG: hypothetical protein ABIO44_11930 [Saprospiraceae bacterium]
MLLVFFIVSNTIYAQSTDSLLKVVSKEKSPVLQFQLWAQIAYIYAQNNNDSGNAYASQKLLSAAFVSRNDTLIAGAYSFLGANAEDKGDFDHALEYDFKALQIAEAMNFKYAICQTAEQIAVVYKQLKNVKETLRFLRKAEAFLSLPEIREGLLRRAVYTNTAEIFLADKQTDSALVYAQKANEVTKKENDVFGYSRILLEFGQIYSEKGENDLDETYFKKGITFCDTACESLNLISTLYEYSRHLLKNNQPQLAKFYALRSLAEHNKFRNRAGTLSIEITDILSRVYSSLK